MSHENQNQARNFEGILSPLDPTIQRLEEEQKVLKNQVVSLEESHQQLRESISSLEDSFQSIEGAHRRLHGQLNNFQVRHNLYHRDTIELRKLQLWRFSSMNSITSEPELLSAINIALDADVCRQLKISAPDVAFFRAIQGFRNLYGIGYPDYLDNFRNAPAAIRDSLNIKANLEYHIHWKRERYTDVGAELVYLCEGILDGWLRSRSEMANDEIHERYREMKCLYDNWLSQIIVDCNST